MAWRSLFTSLKAVRIQHSDYCNLILPSTLWFCKISNDLNFHVSVSFCSNFKCEIAFCINLSWAVNSSMHCGVNSCKRDPCWVAAIGTIHPEISKGCFPLSLKEAQWQVYQPFSHYAGTLSALKSRSQCKHFIQFSKTETPKSYNYFGTRQ